MSTFTIQLASNAEVGMEKKQFQLGDIVQMKKPHPCGSNEMEIIRMGMDIRIKCAGCKHSVLVPRVKFESKFKKVIRSSNDHISSESN